MRISEAHQVILEMLKVNAELAQQEGIDLANVTLVPMLESPPGVGKSSIVAQAADQLSAELRTVRLSDREPTDVTGWHVPAADNKSMTHIRPDWLPTGDEGKMVIVFFDELPQGSTAAQNTVAQCVNERRVGSYEVPPNCFFICAGNATAHRAGTNHMPTHLRDRLNWLEVEAHAPDTCDYFSEVGVDTRLIAYLRFRSEMLSKFDKDAKACPSPRSWEKVNTTLKCQNLPSHLMLQAIAGQVGEGAASDFTGYLKLVEAVPDMDALIAEPEKAPIPSDLGILYAVGTELASRYTKDNATNIATYLKRLPKKEITAFVLTDLSRRHGRSIAQNRGIMDLLAEVAINLDVK